MKTTIIWAAIFGLSGILLGAIGAHALKVYLDAQQIMSFETGVRYQMYHALFLLFLALLQERFPAKAIILIRNLTIIGTIGFSFSIYLLATQSLLGISFGFLWPVTPIGGVVLIAAWSILLYNSIKFVALKEI